MEKEISLYRLQSNIAKELRLAMSEIHNLKTWCISEAKPTHEQILVRIATAESHLIDAQKMLG